MSYENGGCDNCFNEITTTAVHFRNHQFCSDECADEFGERHNRVISTEIHAEQGELFEDLPRSEKSFRKVMLFCMAIAVVIVFAASSFASETMMRQHLDWIGENTEYDTTDMPLPRIEYLNKAQMQVAFYGPDEVARWEMVKNTSLREVVAFYDSDREVIVLRQGFDFTEGGATLVHELVHHVQKRAGTYVHGEDCVGDSEEEAYTIQEQWETENGYESEICWFCVKIQQMQCINPHM